MLKGLTIVWLYSSYLTTQCHHFMFHNNMYNHIEECNTCSQHMSHHTFSLTHTHIHTHTHHKISIFQHLRHITIHLFI